MGKDEQTPHKRGHMNGQWAHEQTFYIIIHQENANENHNETPLSTH